MKYCFVILIIFVFQAAFADTNHHEHNALGESKVLLTLNNGQKWLTDKPLRENMSAIHDHIKTRLNRIHNQKMSDPEYQDLSKKIKENIDAIFANCELTPEADAQLHIVLAGMLSANSKVSEKFSQKDKASAVRGILENYKAYLKHFEHSETKAH